jgi:hypothetical protein
MQIMSKEIIIPKKQIELGFQSLLDRYENPTSTSTNNADVAATKTKGDAIFDSSMRQHEAASRLSDTVSLLKDVGQTLSDPKSSKLKCKEAIKITMKTVVPMISIVANEMSAAANIVAPIGGTKYVHTRVETKRRREKTAGDADQRKKQSLKKSMVDDFVGGRSQLSYLPPKSRKMPSRATKNKNILPITVNPPNPKNPPHYTPMEFLEIVEAIQINSAKRRLMIEKIIINEFIPGSLRSAYNMIKKSKDDLPIPCEWRHHSGRPPLISLDGFKQLVDEYSKECGKAIDKNVINNILLKYANENAKKNGYAPSTFVQYNRTTCKNYFALFANQNKINLAKSVVSKTNSRFTAENSLMASVVLLCVVATTHFFVVEREDIKVKEIVNKMDQDDRLLYDLVSAFHGNRPIFPVHPYLLFTSDDKTQYIFEGTIEGKKKDEWKSIQMVITHNHSIWSQFQCMTLITLCHLNF